MNLNRHYIIAPKVTPLTNKYSLNSLSTGKISIVQDGQNVAMLDMANMIPFLDNGVLILNHQNYRCEFSGFNVAEWNLAPFTTTQAMLDDIINFFL